MGLVGHGRILDFSLMKMRTHWREGFEQGECSDLALLHMSLLNLQEGIYNRQLGI